jgi:hypothetical protein
MLLSNAAIRNYEIWQILVNQGSKFTTIYLYILIFPIYSIDKKKRMEEQARPKKKMDAIDKTFGYKMSFEDMGKPYSIVIFNFPWLTTISP